MAAANAKTGLTVSVNFTPQAKDDILNFDENASFGAIDIDRAMLANDGAANAATIVGITSDSVSDVKARLTNYITSLDNFSKPKAGDVTLSGMGVVSLDKDGNITFSPTANLDALGANDSLDGKFTYIIRMANGAYSVATSTIHIQGSNDAAKITGMHAGDVTEDSTTQATGQLTVADVDNGENVLHAASVGHFDGTYGAFDITSGGTWTFTINNAAAAVQALGKDVTAEQTITVWSKDKTASETITVKIHGVNDGPTTADATNSGDEDTKITGQLSASDVDDNDQAPGSLTFAIDGTAPAGFELNADGSYELDASDTAYQHLGKGQPQDVVVKYTVSDAHGGSADANLTITVTGVNDVATFGTNDSGAVTEDGVLTASGLLTTDDVDDGETGYATETGYYEGTYGKFYFDAASGMWDYELTKNSGDAVQGLDDGDKLVDTLTVETIDGTQHDIKVTINGTSEITLASQHEDVVTTWTVTGKGDPQHGKIVLQGSDWKNVKLEIVGAAGDFDWDKEGFTFTGDATGTYKGANDKNSVLNNDPETKNTISLDQMVADPAFTVDYSKITSDGSFDYKVAFTSETNNKSELTLKLTYDYWGV